MCWEKHNLHHKCCGNCVLFECPQCPEAPTKSGKACPRFENEFIYVAELCHLCVPAKKEPAKNADATRVTLQALKAGSNKEMNARSGYAFFSQIDRGIIEDDDYQSPMFTESYGEESTMVEVESSGMSDTTDSLDKSVSSG
jgi:hypothetical protein